MPATANIMMYGHIAGQRRPRVVSGVIGSVGMAAWLLVLLGAASVCSAQDAAVLDRAQLDRTLDAVRAKYAAVVSSRIESSSVRESATQESTVFRSGQFVARDWRANEDGGTPRLTNLVYAANGMLRGMHGPPRFIETTMPAGYLDAPGQVHHWTNPWPLLDAWCLAIRNDPGRTATRSGGAIMITSPELGLSLTFGQHLECLAVERALNGFRSHIVFTGYAPGPGQPWPQPTGMRRHFELDRAGPDRARVDEWAISTLSFNADDEDRTLFWDPDRYGVYRYDPATRNVYASDGSLMYNEEEFSNRVMRMAGLTSTPRRWRIPSLIALAVVLGGVAYWRLRR